jgi:hypothetical protein
MKKIKFAHKYDKMLNVPDINAEMPKMATLMEVFKVKSEELHPRFIEYDTMYITKNHINYYKLPSGNVLILLLRSGDMIWTTIRRWTPKKEEYYRKSRWEVFDIVLTSTPHNSRKTTDKTSMTD